MGGSIVKKNHGVLFLLVCLLTHACSVSADTPEKTKVRSSVLAGSWYTESKTALTKQIDGYLKNVPSASENASRVRALIAPHAGYDWSGQTAAYSYKAIQGASYKRVILLGPSHRTHFRGGSIADVEAYETPLGQVPLDRTACDSLLTSPAIGNHKDAHTQEHSLEIQLPFLQRTLKDFQLIPIVISELTIDDCKEIANRIRPLLDADTLLVVSSDFTHQGPRFAYQPFKTDIKKNVQRLDFAAVNHILNLDVRGFWAFTDGTRATICGRNPIKIAMLALPVQTQVEFTHYETSGDKQNDYKETVSYCSLVFRERSDYLNEEETALAIEIARKTLEQTFQSKKSHRIHAPGRENHTPAKRKKRRLRYTA